MLVREYIEQREADTLSRFATLSRDSRGREHPLEPCPLRTDFVRDRDRNFALQVLSPAQAQGRRCFLRRRAITIARA